MKSKKKFVDKYLVFLMLIVALGAALRFFSLSDFPVSLNWDEVSHGYNAFSILKTGKDQWGQFLPIFNFRAYGDYPLPLNLYLTIPFVAALGLNEFAVRLPHALLGIGTIMATYFFATGLTKRKEVGLVASFLTAIDPWSLFTARFVLQSNVAVFFLTTAAALFFNREKRKYFLPLSIVCLGLTLYAYHTTRIISPLILASAVLIYWKKVKIGIISIILTLVLFVPNLYALVQPQARARSNVVFILNDTATAKIISQRQSSKLPSIAARLVYNRPVYFVWNFVGNYLDYFSPEFLFVKGGTQYQFSIPNWGVLQFASLPFFYIGLVFLARKINDNKDYQLVAAWLFLAPIPAAMTVDKFAVVRATSMLPLPQLLSALGLFAFLDFAAKKKIRFLKPIVLISFFVLLAYGLESYTANYIRDYSKNYSWSWQYGYKQIVQYAKENYSKYDKIIITKKYGEPHEYFLFYLAYDPAKYQNDTSAIRFYQSGWYWVDHFDKFWFVNDWQVPHSIGQDLITESKVKIDCKNIKCLLITSPGNSPAGWNKIKKVDFLDGKPDFEIYENISR